jgi:hypothetical protein
MSSRVRFSPMAMGLRGHRSEISSEQMFNRYKFQISFAYSAPPCFRFLMRLRRFTAVLLFLDHHVPCLAQCAIQ